MSDVPFTVADIFPSPLIPGIEETTFVLPVFTFPEGLFGFEEYKTFALVDSDYEPFIWLHSWEDSNLAFLIVDPFLICNSYETDIDDEILGKIDIKKPEDIIIMTIVTVPHDMSEEHHIDWIAFDADGTIGKKMLNNKSEAKAIFPYKKGSIVYAYCNVHGL